MYSSSTFRQVDGLRERDAISAPGYPEETHRCPQKWQRVPKPLAMLTENASFSVDKRQNGAPKTPKPLRSSSNPVAEGFLQVKRVSQCTSLAQPSGHGTELCPAWPATRLTEPGGVDSTRSCAWVL